MSSAQAHSRLKSERQAGRYLSERGIICARTLTNLRYRGEAPPHYLIGSRILYDVRDLDTWVDARRRSPLRVADASAANSLICNP